MTANYRNYCGDGYKEEKNAGLSTFGEKVIHEVNRPGIAVDLSHCGRAMIMEAIKVAKEPPLITHSNCCSVYKTFQNKKDEELQALAERGES